MEYKEVTLSIFLVMLGFSLLCFIPFVSANTIFVGIYRATSYSFEPPSSTEYTVTRTSGGSIQTYYGIFTNTSLDVFSDMELTGSFKGYSSSWKIEDKENYYDANERLILGTAKLVTKLNGKVESWADRSEYGNYIGNYPSRNDIIKAHIGDQWNYTYEQREYEDGRYEETHICKVEIVVKDFPTKVVEAGTFSTVRVEKIEWEDEVLYSRDIKWRRLSDGKLVSHESYDWEDGEWSLFMKEELISEKETEATKEPTEGLSISTIAIIGTAVVVISIASFLTYRLLKRRKKVSETSLND
jgi:hypothetical protein